MKTNRFLACLTLLCSSLILFAADPATDLKDYVTSLHSQCPVYLRDGWVAQSFEVNNDATTVTLTLNIDPSQFSMMKEDKVSMRPAFLKELLSFGEKWENLIGLSAKAQMPLIIDMVPLTGEDVLSLSYTPEELSSAK